MTDLLEQQRIAARERKRKSRAARPDAISLPLPMGTHHALTRIVEAAGFDDARDFLAFQIHRLDHLLQCDGHAFKAQAVRTVTAGDLTKYIDRITTHTVQRIASGEYVCSCGRQWDADEGDECPATSGDGQHD